MVTREEGWGEGIVRELGMDMHTLLYLKWITNKVLLYSTGNSAQYYVAMWMEEGFGGNGYMYKCMVESLWCASEIITKLLIDYTPIKKIVKKKIRDKIGQNEMAPRSPCKVIYKNLEVNLDNLCK